MAPQDPSHFEPAASTDWISADSHWFRRLADAREFSLAERVHLARVALQQQWICDVEDTSEKRVALKEFGVHIATENLGYLIASGSAAMAEYFAFRRNEISTVEAGALYGYPASAVASFAGIVPHVPPKDAWMSTATYFLGGAYSRDHSDRELAIFAGQWAELERYAPTLCALAEAEFKRVKPTLSSK